MWKSFAMKKRKKVSKTAPDSNSNIGYYQWWIYVVKVGLSFDLESGHTKETKGSSSLSV